jgi:peptidoglycan/LPS O-acetylase OafA/YrhL
MERPIRNDRPKKQPHIPALDGLRGLAVILVFVFHYGGGTHSSVRAMQLFGFFNRGNWAGVTLFFILSGFLITGILWDSYSDPHWFRNFYMRRTLRIFPLYFAAIAFVLVAARFEGTFIPALKMIWVPLLFLQNIPPLVGNINNLPSPFPLYHFWSLAVEEQFYLIWPFLLVLQKTRERAKFLCLVTFLTSCLFRIIVWRFLVDPTDYAEFLLSRAGELAAGGWLAIAYRGPEWKRIERFAPFVATIGLAGFLSVGVLSRSFEVNGLLMADVGLPCITLFFAALIVTAIRPGLVQSLATAAWLRWIGGISYGIYVFHVLFLKIFEEITRPLARGHGLMAHNAISFCVAAAGSIGLAWLSFHLYENPILRLKSRFAPAVRKLTN